MLHTGTLFRSRDSKIIFLNHIFESIIIEHSSVVIINPPTMTCLPTFKAHADRSLLLNPTRHCQPDAH